MNGFLVSFKRMSKSCGARHLQFQVLMLVLLLCGLSVGVSLAQADVLADARQQMQAGNDVQAVVLLEAWTQDHNSDYEAYFLLGMAYTQQGKFIRAIEMFRHVSALRPELAEPYGNLAVIYNELGRPQSAALELEKFLERKPGDPVTHENLGDIHVQLALRNYKLALARVKTPELLKKYQQLLQLGKPENSNHGQVVRQKVAATDPETNRESRLFTSRISVSAPVPAVVPVRQLDISTKQITPQSLPAVAVKPETEYQRGEQPADMTVAGKPDAAEPPNAFSDRTIGEDHSQQKTNNAWHSIPVEQQVVNAVERWRSAWAGQDLHAYFDAYDVDFTPDSGNLTGKPGLSRAAWKTYKSRVISGKKYIHITLNNMRIQILDHGMRAQVRFLQFFGSNNYASQDDKEMTFKKEAHGWKIIGERVL